MVEPRSIGREALMSNLYAYCRNCPTEIIDPSGAVCTYLSATLTPDGTVQTIKIPAGAYIVTDTIPGGPKVGQTVGKQMNLSSLYCLFLAVVASSKLLRRVAPAYTY